MDMNEIDSQSSLHGRESAAGDRSNFDSHVFDSFSQRFMPACDQYLPDVGVRQFADQQLSLPLSSTETAGHIDMGDTDRHRCKDALSVSVGGSVSHTPMGRSADRSYAALRRDCGSEMNRIKCFLCNLRNDT